MNAVQHIVKLGPSAVELVDSTMLDLARGIPAFRHTIDSLVRQGQAPKLCCSWNSPAKTRRSSGVSGRLETLVSDLGYPDCVVRATETGVQAKLAELRKAGLNIMMSHEGGRKPVHRGLRRPLNDLAEYTDRLTRCSKETVLKGTLYAHASVGCLHVRPVLNMKDASDAKKMR